MLGLEHVIGRLVLAAFPGSVVGFERERHDKAAAIVDRLNQVSGVHSVELAV